MGNIGIHGISNPSTRFVVKNITLPHKIVKVFQLPIRPDTERDLLMINGISESDIRHSLLKGELFLKLKKQELVVTESSTDLLQFSNEHKAFLQSHGITIGLEVEGSGSTIPEAQHKVLLQLVHLAETGPWDGFGNGLFKETLPAGPFPTSIIWWTSITKEKKILEKTITYAGPFESVIVYQVFDVDGITVTATATDTITRNGAFETSRLRTFS